MSDDTNSGELPPENDSPPVPTVRRISNKNPRRSEADSDPGGHSDDSDPVSLEEFDGDPTDDNSAQKRPNRRRRGKAKSTKDPDKSEVESDAPAEEVIHLGTTGPSEPQENSTQRDSTRPQRPPQKQRSKPDPEKVATKAWKIYLAEVSEEGVALIGDNDARELARRCFRLAEIFLDEEIRRT